MRESTTPCTVFEFVMTKLFLLESCFSELSSFSASDSNAVNFYYDPIAHRFKQRDEKTQTRSRDFILEIEFSLDDITLFPKFIFNVISFLANDLTSEEIGKVSIELDRLVGLIDSAYENIKNYVNSNRLPENLKQKMTKHLNQIKNLISECQILEVETAIGKSDYILSKVTKDVDDMIRHMPFVVSSDERSRIIQERFKEQIDKLKSLK